MRLKTYTAQTTAEAMGFVRAELGDEAIIVSSQRLDDDQGVRVTAALENLTLDVEPACFATEKSKEDIPGTLRQVLTGHGSPLGLVERLVAAASSLDAKNSTMALAGSVDALFSFQPLTEPANGKPVMLIGPPGAGKTITVAKLAARSTLNKLSVGVITTDSQRAGAIEQLQAFTRILKCELKSAQTIDELSSSLLMMQNLHTVYIDTPGTNPFNDKEMDQLAENIKVSGAEAILVLPAGGDALEMAEAAASFTAIGANSLLITRVDMARRLGGVLAAADAGNLKFSEISISPGIGDGLSPINPVSLARILMPDFSDNTNNSYTSEAAS